LTYKEEIGDWRKFGTAKLHDFHPICRYHQAEQIKGSRWHVWGREMGYSGETEGKT